MKLQSTEWWAHDLKGLALILEKLNELDPGQCKEINRLGFYLSWMDEDGTERGIIEGSENGEAFVVRFVERPNDQRDPLKTGD